MLVLFANSCVQCEQFQANSVGEVLANSSKQTVLAKCWRTVLTKCWRTVPSEQCWRSVGEQFQARSFDAYGSRYIHARLSSRADFLIPLNQVYTCYKPDSSSLKCLHRCWRVARDIRCFVLVQNKIYIYNFVY